MHGDHEERGRCFVGGSFRFHPSRGFAACIKSRWRSTFGSPYSFICARSFAGWRRVSYYWRGPRCSSGGCKFGHFGWPLSHARWRGRGGCGNHSFFYRASSCARPSHAPEVCKGVAGGSRARQVSVLLCGRGVRAGGPSQCGRKGGQGQGPKGKGSRKGKKGVSSTGCGADPTLVQDDAHHHDRSEFNSRGAEAASTGCGGRSNVSPSSAYASVSLDEHAAVCQVDGAASESARDCPGPSASKEGTDASCSDEPRCGGTGRRSAGGGGRGSGERRQPCFGSLGTEQGPHQPCDTYSGRRGPTVGPSPDRSVFHYKGGSRPREASAGASSAQWRFLSRCCPECVQAAETGIQSSQHPGRDLRQQIFQCWPTWSVLEATGIPEIWDWCSMPSALFWTVPSEEI